MEPPRTPGTPNFMKAGTSLAMISSRLNLDEETRTKAEMLLGRLKTALRKDGGDEEAPYWIACAVFVACRDQTTKLVDGSVIRGNGVSLGQLLRATNLTLVEFFSHMKTFVEEFRLGEGIEEEFKSLVQQLTLAIICFRKYETIYDTFFKSTFSNGVASHANDKLFSFGWLLFITVRAKLLGNSPDLLTAYYALLACVNVLLVNAGRDAFRPDLNLELHKNGSDPMDTSMTEIDRYKLLMSKLFESTDTKPEDVSVIQTHLNEYLRSIQPTLFRLDEAIQVFELPGMASPLLMGGLLITHLNANLQSLERNYDQLVQTSGRLDETLFLSREGAPIGTPSKLSSFAPSRPAPSSGMGSFVHRQLFEDQISNNTSHSNIRDMEFPSSIPSSPYARSVQVSNQAPIPQTPLTATLELKKWLQEAVQNQPDHPSSEVIRFCKACPQDPEESIRQRVARLNELLYNELSGEDNGTAGDSPGKKKLLNTTKLYYLVLEQLLLAEEARLHQSNFSNILNNENFHLSLFACAFEAVSNVLPTVSLSFPKILQVLNLKPFEFFKVIESFVKHGPTLPSAIKRQFHDIEDRIMESMAWQTGSPVLEILSQQMQPPTAPATNGGEESGAVSTRKVGSTKNIEFFLKKTLSQCAMRIHELCRRLEIPQNIVDQVWDAVKYVLAEKWDLLRDRHIDQIIMCTIYGACKVNQLKQPDVSFKRIIEKYKKLPRAQPRTFRDVLLKAEGQRGDIIAFYNQVFIDLMKQFLLQYQPSTSTSTSSTTAGSNVNSNPSLSPRPAPTVPTTAFSSSSSAAAFSSSSSASSSLLKPPVTSMMIPSSPLRARVPALAPNSPLVSALPRTSAVLSPQRISNSNLFVSPMKPNQPAGSFTIQQSLHPPASPNTFMTPRTRTLYAFGESPSRDLQTINRTLKRAVGKLDFDNASPERSNGDGPNGAKRQRSVLERKLAALSNHSSSPSPPSSQ